MKCLFHASWLTLISLPGCSGTSDVPAVSGGAGNAGGDWTNPAGGTSTASPPTGGTTSAVTQAVGGSVTQTGGTSSSPSTSATGGNSGAGGTTAGSQPTGGNSNTGGSATACSDTCATSSTGFITVGCQKRFMYGVNYAWQNFGTDFGGYKTWSQPGVSASKSKYTTAIQDMANNGVDVIRWWMFPNLDTTDGITWSGTDNPTGLGSTTAADIQAALDIAASLNVHIQLTLFSFDDFKTANTRRMDHILSDSTKMTNLVNNVVKPVAAAVAASANKDRMISWDVINEPEWAITGTDSYKDPAFGPDNTCTPVTFTVMETFIKNVVTALHAGSSAPVSVGSAAIKWAKAWSNVGVDFYTFHTYGWVNDYYPYDQPPSYFGVTGKPVNIGEFPLTGLPASTIRGTAAVDYVTMLNKLWSAGYAGAQGWAVTDTNFNWSGSKANVKAFATAKGCMVHY